MWLCPPVSAIHHLSAYKCHFFFQTAHVPTDEQRMHERQTARTVHSSNSEHRRTGRGGAKAASDNFIESNSENPPFCMEKEKQESTACQKRLRVKRNFYELSMLDKLCIKMLL